MNYDLIYKKLMDRARGRLLEGYVERHHIVPKCLGGTDDPLNVVALTPEEHYLAHQILVKLNPGHRGLLLAATSMAAGGNSHQGRAGNKNYGWLKRRWSSVSNRKLTDQQKKQQSARLKARWDDPVTRNEMTKKLRGRVIGPMSDENKKKISDACKGKPKRDGFREKMVLENARRRLLKESKI